MPTCDLHRQRSWTLTAHQNHLENFYRISMAGSYLAESCWSGLEWAPTSDISQCSRTLCNWGEKGWGRPCVHRVKNPDTSSASPLHLAQMQTAPSCQQVWLVSWDRIGAAWAGGGWCWSLSRSPHSGWSAQLKGTVHCMWRAWGRGFFDCLTLFSNS